MRDQLSVRIEFMVVECSQMVEACAFDKSFQTEKLYPRLSIPLIIFKELWRVFSNPIVLRTSPLTPARAGKKNIFGVLVEGFAFHQHPKNNFFSRPG